MIPERSDVVRVVVVDDEPVIRAGVTSILSSDAAIRVVAEAEDGQEAIDIVRRFRPDVVLLDIRMPGQDGLAACREILREVPATKVVILTTFGEDENIAEAVSSGAVGFLLKASDPRELLTAVHAAADGAAYLSPRVAHRILHRLRQEQPDRQPESLELLSRLSSRERDVLALVGAGHSNAKIAARLHLVEGTVKGHVSAIMTKTGTKNRVEAALLARDSRLTDQQQRKI